MARSMPLARGRAHLLGGDEVERVGHGQDKLVAARAHGHDRVLLGDVLGKDLRHLRRDVGCGQIDVVDAQLHHERVDELALGDHAGLDELVAQASLALLLRFERSAELLVGDDTRIDKQVAESHVLHVGCISLWFACPACRFAAKHS